jgi:tripartite-type tricarboxylate transporter receptor subunit TctC
VRVLIRLSACFAIISLVFYGNAAWSQTRGTIKVVVPFPAGGTATILARLLAEQIGRMQGATVMVENRPGAGGIIGAEAVAHAAPDERTLLIHASTFLTNPYLQKVNYDPLTSFEPICNLARQPSLFLVNGKSPYRRLADLVDVARNKPGQLTLAAVGPASPFSIAFNVFKRSANVDMTFVPFPGGAPVISTLLGEHVTSAIALLGEAAEQLDSGRLRALATGSQERIKSLPQVPTLVEAGYQAIDMDNWNGVTAPAKTPKETLAQLASLFTAALQAPDMKSKLVAQGLYPVGMCGAEYAAFLRKSYDEFGRIIREENMRRE